MMARYRISEGIQVKDESIKDTKHKYIKDTQIGTFTNAHSIYDYGWWM